MWSKVDSGLLRSLALSFESSAPWLDLRLASLLWARAWILRRLHCCLCQLNFCRTQYYCTWCDECTEKIGLIRYVNQLNVRNSIIALVSKPRPPPIHDHDQFCREHHGWSWVGRIEFHLKSNQNLSLSSDSSFPDSVLCDLYQPMSYASLDITDDCFQIRYALEWVSLWSTYFCNFVWS